MDKTREEYEEWCDTREFDHAVIYSETDIDKAFLLVWKAATEAKANEWISVEDRLPNHLERVLTGVLG